MTGRVWGSCFYPPSISLSLTFPPLSFPFDALLIQSNKDWQKECLTTPLVSNQSINPLVVQFKF